MNNLKCDDKQLEDFISKKALHMARLCVRNTVIEKYHSAGKLTDPEMEQFNREVADKLYSYLQLCYNPKLEKHRLALFNQPYFAVLPDWDPPTFDRDFSYAIKQVDESS